MNSIIAFALGVLLLSTPAFAMGSKQPIKDATDIMKPADEPKPYPTTPVGPMLIIGKCTNCTVKELAYIREAEAKMNEVVAGTCFQSKLQSLPLIQTNGKTPTEVVQSLLGAEVKIDVEMYYTLKRVLGYTLPTAKKEWLNRRYMLRWSVCDLGSLLAHETSHKVGYDHDFQATARRPQSVPYSINTAFKACCSQ